MSDNNKERKQAVWAWLQTAFTNEELDKFDVEDVLALVENPIFQDWVAQESE